MAELMRDVMVRDIVSGGRAARAGMVGRRAVLWGRLCDATDRLVGDRTDKAWDVLCAWSAWADVHCPLGPVCTGCGRVGCNCPGTVQAFGYADQWTAEEILRHDG